VYADGKEESDVRKYDAGQDKKESKKMNIEIDYDAESGNVGVFLRFTMLKSKKGLGSECKGDESREIAGDGHVLQTITKCLPGRTGRRKNRPSRPSMSMTARRPGTFRGRHKPRPRQSSTVPGRHRVVVCLFNHTVLTLIRV
jgi:hypothetical protein